MRLETLDNRLNTLHCFRANKDSLKAENFQIDTQDYVGPNKNYELLRLLLSSPSQLLSLSATIEKRTPSPDGSGKVATSTEADGI